MKVYIINFILLVVVGWFLERFKNKSVHKMYCIYAWLQLTVLAAVRWGNGIDYNYYFNTFFRISYAEGWSEILQHRNEIGYLVFTRLVTTFTDNIIVYLFLFYGVMYGLLMLYIYKYSELKWLSVAVFITFDYFAMSFCFMRQCMAMVIGLFVIEMIKKRKTIWAITLTLIAAMFHTAALILLAYLVISYFDFTNKKVRNVMLIGGVLFYWGFDVILESLLVGPFAKYSSYIGTDFMKGNHVLIVFYPLFICILVMFFDKLLLEKDPDFKYMIPVIFLGTVFSIMTTKHYVIERLGLYATIYNIRVLAQLVDMFKDAVSKLYYRLAIATALWMNVFALAFGLKMDRYVICPYQVNETYLHDVEFFKDTGAEN